MLIIAGHLIVDPEDRDAYLAECVPVVQAARKATGCLDFAITADALDASRIDVYERWDGDESLATFRGDGPPGAMADRILSADVRKYRISAVESP